MVWVCKSEPPGVESWEPQVPGTDVPLQGQSCCTGGSAQSLQCPAGRSRSTDGAHVWSSTAGQEEEEEEWSHTCLSQSCLTSAHSMSPECHTVQQPAAVTMARINIPLSSLWKDFLFSLFQGLISFSLCHSQDCVLPFFSKWFGTDASTTGFQKPDCFFILSLYSTQHDRGPLHPPKY